MKDQWKEKEKELLEKAKKMIKELGYGKVAILLVAVVVLIVLCLPTSFFHNQKQEDSVSVSQKEERTDVNDQNDYVSLLEQRLTNMLSSVSGIGETDVMITLKSSSEDVVNKDTTSSQSSEVDGEVEEQEEETVLLEDSEGNKKPYVIKTIQPQVEGVLVVCEGGEDPEIISSITSAAEVLFSVSPHKVKVMKKFTSDRQK